MKNVKVFRNFPTIAKVVVNQLRTVQKYALNNTYVYYTRRNTVNNSAVKVLKNSPTIAKVVVIQHRAVKTCVK